MLYRKKRAAERYRKLLTAKEAELLELTTKAEEYIEAIKKPDLRIMFRFYYLEGLTWIQVAYRLNRMFPKRRVKYTEDGWPDEKIPDFLKKNKNVRSCSL